MSFYRRNLPHWQPSEAEYFITFRLAGTLPKNAIEYLKKERDKLEKAYSSGCQPELHTHIQKMMFKNYEQLLDKGAYGPKWLRKKNIARIVNESIHYRDSEKYDLYAYCLMANHVHLVFKHLPDPEEQDGEYPITKILMSLKRYTARQCNKVLNRKGAFWQNESYDRVIRNANELERIISYTLNNPVNAGRVENWEKWPYTYCKPEFLSTFQSTG